MLQPWFTDAKLGIFIHWGLYSVKGVAESWSFYNGQISYADYMAQAKGFTAANYDPEAWADLFARAGARYAVLTTKHHDGFALWDTRLSELNCVTGSPAGRDLVTPFCRAVRKRGLKVGLYFSQLDWSHPDYASIPHTGLSAEAKKNRWDYPADGRPDPARWERYIRFHQGQLEELCTRFGKVDLLWFDGDWTRDCADWRFAELREKLHGWQPKVILNSRMKGHVPPAEHPEGYGDYATPEQGLPTVAPRGAWEFCMTLNNSWGWQPKDRDYKSLRQIVRTFAEVIGMGGNLLLDIGPKADGSVPRIQAERLEGLGAWIERHQEAVYGTVAGLPPGLFYGASTLSKNRRTLYLFVFDRPVDGVALKGVKNKIKRVTVLGKKQVVPHRVNGGAPWLGVPGIAWIDVPARLIDPEATVLKVELDGPLDLHLSAGQAITAN